MNLPCDAVTVHMLMVITCVLIYAIRYCICAYELLLPSTCTFYIISASRCTVYTCSGVAYELIYCGYISGVTLVQ